MRVEGKLPHGFISNSDKFGRPLADIVGLDSVHPDQSRPVRIIFLRKAFNEQGSLRMYANILLSTDGSDVARTGVKHGIALAKALNAKVTIITVTEPLPIDYGSGHASGWIPTQEEFDRFDAACKEHAVKVLDDARAMAEQIGISAELVHVPNAHPATAIIETAKSRGCDLIVMASHGRRGLRKLFLGSQTSEVLVDGSVPVLVVHERT
jgi:nucleotide-binding universal stress UspA family protein